MQGMVPLYGFGGGSGGTGATLNVTAPAGCTVTVSKDGKTKMKVADSSGVAVFKGLATGEWTITITNGTQTNSKTVYVTADYDVTIAFSKIPAFKYTGDYEIVNDEDELITVSDDHWKIRFLTSGTLTFLALNGAENGIDVFIVGGGGGARYGGGGGGYTATSLGIQVIEGSEYSIVVGAGGAAEADGGNSSAFSITALGGKAGSTDETNGKGGDGGSGGGGWATNYGGTGGSNGENGGTGSGQYVRSGGTGQGTTTGEFGNSSSKTYAGGGGGGAKNSFGIGGGHEGGGTGEDTTTVNGAVNTGGGGGGLSENGATPGKGGSGIVIIRNARGVA